MSVESRGVALFLGAVVHLGSVVAVAESVAPLAGTPAPARAIEEVLVTAQRREQAIGDVPQAVQALTSQDLENTGIKSFAETISLIPSASSVSSISVASTVYQVRAIAPGEGIGDATVGYYMDNFAFAMPGLPYAPVIDYFDLNRVEILRGPSGTLYGLGSLGGTVKTITNDPNLDVVEMAFKGSGAWSSDADPSRSGDVMINTPLIEGKLGIRGVVSWRERGGYAEILPFSRDNGNPSERFSGRLKILAQPTDDLSVKVSYWGNRSRQEFLDRVTFYDPARIDNTDGSGESDYELLVGDIEYDLGYGLLQSTTGYMQNKLRDNNDGRIALPIGSFESQIPQDSKSLNQDLRFSADAFNESLSYIVGAFYQDAETEGGQKVLLPENTQVPGNVGLFTSNDNITESESWALYGEGTYTLPSVPVDVTVGLRYYREERTFDQNSVLQFLTSGVIVETIGVTGSDEDSFNPRLNVAWRPTENGMLYVGATKGFRSGAINSTALVTAANAALGTNFTSANEPDELWNYEFGAKWSLFEDALQVNAALYFIDWGDAQVAISPAAQFIIVPVGDVEGTGLDLEIFWNTPIEGLTISASGNINDTELTNVDPRIEASTAPRLQYMKEGNQLVGTVEETFATVLNYERSLGYMDWMMNYNFRYSFRGKQQSSYDGRFTPSLKLASTRLAFSNERYEVEIFSDNLTDDKGPISVPGGQHVVPYPRTVGIGVGARF